MRDRTFLIRSLAGLLSLALLLAGVGGLAAPSSAGLTGSASGTVTGPDGQPLAGVEVTLFQGYSGEGSLVGVVQTEADGTYRFDGLYPSQYWLHFHSADYVDEYWDDATDLSDATGFTVSMDQLVGGMDAQLAEAGHIAGMVTGPNGEPAPDIYVSAYEMRDGSRTRGAPHGATTGADGSYDVGSLPPGTYRLEFANYYSTDYLGEYWHDVANIHDATDIVVTEGQTASGKDAELASGGHLTGTVTAPGGAGIRDVEVVAYRWEPNDEYWDWVTSSTTDPDGSYDVSALPAGTYRLAFYDYDDRYLNEYWDDAANLDAATDIDVTAGETVSGKNAELSKGGHLSGTVTAPDGTPLGDVEVDLYAWDGGGEFWDWTDVTWTDLDGTYDVGGLPPGRYRLGFYDENERYAGEFWDDAASWDAATDIDLTAGETASGRDARLAEDRSGDGHLGGAVTGPDGHYLSAVSVRAYRWNGGQLTWAASTMTDGAGGYDLTLPPGDYAVWFEDPSGAYVGEYWNDAPTAATATSIHVGAGTSLTDISPRLAAAVRPVTNVVPPTISGSLLVGETLIADAGAWTPAASTVRFQWLINGLAVPGATGPTYIPVAADVGKPLQVRVTGSASGHSEATATSASVRIGYRQLQLVKKPVVRGAVKRGAVLRVLPGAWRSVRPTMRWGWFAGGQRILGANDRPLRLRGRIAELVTGKRITVRLSAFAEGYQPASMTLKVRHRLR